MNVNVKVKVNVKSMSTRLNLALILIGLLSGTTGCYLNVYQAATTAPAGQFVFWWGLGGLITPAEGFLGYAPQLHVRYGILPRLDVGLGSGFLIAPDLAGVEFLGVVGDLRYQLLADPDFTIGWMPGSFPLGNVLGSGALYLSRTFGTLTPYGVYRALVLLEEGGLSFSHQLSAGVEIANPEKLPAIFELSWKDGRFLLGLAFRY
jgi:hypothetical protein